MLLFGESFAEHERKIVVCGSAETTCESLVCTIQKTNCRKAKRVIYAIPFTLWLGGESRITQHLLLLLLNQCQVSQSDMLFAKQHTETSSTWNWKWVQVTFCP